MIELRAFEDLAAMAVFNRLDPHDQIEAELTRGHPIGSLGLFAEWRAMQPAAIVSVVAHAAGRPFALFMLVNTGQAGVAAAALLAARHDLNRHALARLAVVLRQNMASFTAERGIHRIECRAWSDHPTASRLLGGLGFQLEAEMSGFGRSGQIHYRQFSWLSATATQPKQQWS
jgi:hypothetical protein